MCVYDVDAPVITYVKSLNETQEIKEGESLVLKVSISGASPPKTSWRHNNVEIKPGQHETVGDSTRSFSQLTLKNASVDATGTYKVVAKNEAGSVSAEFNVVIMGSFNSRHLAQLCITLSAFSTHETIRTLLIHIKFDIASLGLSLLTS